MLCISYKHFMTKILPHSSTILKKIFIFSEIAVHYRRQHNFPRFLVQSQHRTVQCQFHVKRHKQKGNFCYLMVNKITSFNCCKTVVPLSIDLLHISLLKKNLTQTYIMDQLIRTYLLAPDNLSWCLYSQILFSAFKRILYICSHFCAISQTV